MTGSETGDWALFYRRLDEPTVWKTLRYKRSDGVLVSAKTLKRYINLIVLKKLLSLLRN